MENTPGNNQEEKNHEWQERIEIKEIKRGEIYNEMMEKMERKEKEGKDKGMKEKKKWRRM